MIGEPDAGNPHVRFDEGVQESCDSATRLCPTLPGGSATRPGDWPFAIVPLVKISLDFFAEIL